MLPKVRLHHSPSQCSLSGGLCCKTLVETCALLLAHKSAFDRSGSDLIVGYVFAIRSERRLCSEVQVNQAYRWFSKLGS